MTVLQEIWHWVEFFLAFKIINITGYQLTVSKLLLAILLFMLVMALSRALPAGIQRVLSHAKTTRVDQVYTLSRVVHYIMVLVAIVLAGSTLGLDFSKLTLIAGALSVGIGFGLQNIVSNFISGLMILFEKQLKVGDLIELESGTFGEVIEINIRSTHIRTADNVDILVPNSEFVSGRVTNWTLTEAVRRFRIPFGVAYGSNKELVRKAALEAAALVPWTLNIPAQDRVAKVWMVGFGDSSLDFVLTVWVDASMVKRPSSLMSEYFWALDDAFRKYHIEIPFPQRDVYIRSQAMPQPPPSAAD